MREQFILEMMLRSPYGKSWSVRMPIDAFRAFESYIELEPPHEFDGRTFDQTVEIIRKKEYRKEDFREYARLLATALGERMEDEEGWHGVSRQETYERRRKEGNP